MVDAGMPRTVRSGKVKGAQARIHPFSSFTFSFFSVSPLQVSMDFRNGNHKIKDEKSPPTASSPDLAGVAHDERVSRDDIGVALEAQMPIDPAMDKHLTRKFDLHIIPWLFGIWQVDSIPALE
jgi:hypothetical protein